MHFCSWWECLRLGVLPSLLTKLGTGPLMHIHVVQCGSLRNRQWSRFGFFRPTELKHLNDIEQASTALKYYVRALPKAVGAKPWISGKDYP